MYTLGIETSCDETGCAIVKNGKVLSNAISSSVHLHEPYGGVIPEIASRYHLEFIDKALSSSLTEAGVLLKDVGLISVTEGPGLPGSLLTGIAYGKALSYALKKPLLGVNHIHAHLYANFLNKKACELPKFPFVGLAVSGGHTSIYLCKALKKFVLLGSTRDDAVGEAFDKVAKILGLGYPGGPLIEKLASEFIGASTLRFPKAFLGKDSLDFSFSGVKTSVLYNVRDKKISHREKAEVCRAFQDAVFDTVVDKALKACMLHNARELVVGGGVACNKTLANKLTQECQKLGVKVFVPEKQFCLDNGAMIAALGEKLYKKGMRANYRMTAKF